MDGCSRQNPAYRSAKETAREGRFYLGGRVVVTPFFNLHRSRPRMNSFDARSILEVGDRRYEIYRLDALQSKFDVARLPFALKVLLENLLRNEGGPTVSASDVE